MRVLGLLRPRKNVNEIITELKGDLPLAKRQERNGDALLFDYQL